MPAVSHFRVIGAGISLFVGGVVLEQALRPGAWTKADTGFAFAAAGLVWNGAATLVQLYRAQRFQ